MISLTSFRLAKSHWRLASLTAALAVAVNTASMSLAVADTPTIEGLKFNQNAITQQLLSIDSQRIDKTMAVVLRAITRNELTEARILLQALTQDYPNYHVGQLLLAELHAAKAGLESALTRERYNAWLMQLLLEASARQRNDDHFLTTDAPTTTFPNGVLKVGTGLHHWIQVDLETGIQTVYQSTGNSLTEQWRQYVGYGSGGFDKYLEGDLKTPLGLYRITGFRGDNTLPDLYGSGALMLDYPNPADKYEHRTGSGIWLHGVPSKSRSRGPYSSEGCVTMGNDYLTALAEMIEPSNTLVALTADSVVKDHNVNLNHAKILFNNWIAETPSNSLIAGYNINWENATVAVSSASSKHGAPGRLVMYFPAVVNTNKASGSKNGNPGFKGLFFGRSDGSDEWKLIADEVTVGDS